MDGEPIRVAELFAGVGGFRLGLEGYPDSDEDTGFTVVWSNQWEPSEKAQWASRIYIKHFGEEGHTNEDIHDIAYNKGVIEETIRERVPKHDLLVGGFPCQDYSVARTISGEMGIKGEKGKLWIPIQNIIYHMRPRPKVVLLENVPRLLNSPANARGRNFAVILNFLLKEGYHVEWRVINAADYGMPQRRSRVFILAYRTSGAGQNYRVNGTDYYGCKNSFSRRKMETWVLGKKGDSGWKPGPFAEAFPVDGELPEESQEVPALDFSFNSKASPFLNAGYAWKSGNGTERTPYRNMYWTTKVKAVKEDPINLGDPSILVEDHAPEYEIDPERLDEWRYAKGTKNEFRLRKRDRDKVDSHLVALYDECMSAPFAERADKWEEHREAFRAAVGENSFYEYVEGPMRFDQLDKPSRTVVTDEIGSTPSRMRHIFEVPGKPGTYRRLMPIEVERLNMFLDNWTTTEFNGKEISASRRGFVMGNALVVGGVRKLAVPLARLMRDRSK